jgi:hypothetical protein
VVQLFRNPHIEDWYTFVSIEDIKGWDVCLNLFFVCYNWRRLFHLAVFASNRIT